MSTTYDLVVIGAGPGGYVAAIRAAQLGLSVACIEKDPTLGGTCLNVGCIPSKALLESSEHYHQAQGGLEVHGVELSGVKLNLPSMMKRKSGVVEQLTGGIATLFKKNKVTRIEGLGRFAGPGSIEVVVDGKVTQTLQAKKTIIATGSVPSSLPGLTLDGDRVGTSTEALSYPEVPKHLIVIGAGVIGLELGSVWARLGSKVTVLEYNSALLPFLDKDLGRLAARTFKKQGLDIILGAKVSGASVEGSTVAVSYTDAKGNEQSLSGDRVLVAVGRRPNTEGLGLDKVGIELDKRGRIPVNARWETSVPGVYAIGDVIEGPMLAHKAEDEGIAAAENIAGQHGHVNYDAIPNVIYTHPEIATVGKSEAELKAAGIPIRSGKFPFSNNGRAKALGDTEGAVKIHAHAETDRILGAQVIGPRASELIAEIVLAVEFSASAEDIARSTHAHPTLAEIVKEAALAVDKRALHS